MSEPHIIVVILNSNRRDDCLDCLASISRSCYDNYRVVVLNNGCDPDALQALHAAAPFAQMVELIENRGYAGNNNVGLELALAQGADWVFLLNEDTVIGPDCLRHLAAVGNADPGIGIVGPMVYHDDERDVIQSAGGILSRWNWQPAHCGQNTVDRGQFEGTRPVDWVSGCAMLVRRALVEQIGMLDERFFLYWEEVDWCLRARKHGWKIIQVPHAKIWHKGVQREYSPTPSVTYYTTRNRFLLLAKHHAPPAAWLASCAQTLRTLVSWTTRPKWRTKREHRDAMWQGVSDFVRGRWGRRVTR